MKQEDNLDSKKDEEKVKSKKQDSKKEGISKEDKEELEEQLEEAIIFDKKNEGLLESLIKEESHVLNVIEKENSKIINQIEEKIEKYSLEKKSKDNYLTDFSEEEKRYDLTAPKLNYIEGEKFVRFKDQERDKKKDDRKYLQFKPSY